MSQVRSNKPAPNQAGVVKIVAVVVVVCLGLWGCARRPGAQTPTGGERTKVLETRLQKIEQDYRTLSQARDRARQDLAALEAENARLKKELAVQTGIAREADKLRQQIKVVAGERDDLRAQMSQRMNEREVLINRCDKLRKGIQHLISQDDHTTAANPGLTPTLPTATPAVNTQS